MYRHYHLFLRRHLLRRAEPHKENIMALINKSSNGNSGANRECCNWHGGDFGKKILITLLGVLLVYLIVFVGTLMRNNLKKFVYIGQADQMERSITVNGFGKANGSNDIAMTTIGHSVVDKDVSKAQAEAKKVVDGVMNELQKMGIADKDLQTNYSIYPEYNYTQDKGQELRGYRVNYSLSVKIRDLSKITAVLSLPGKYGATEVNGLTFTIDDPENLKMEARDKALADAAMKAKKLAQALGVRLVEVISYGEYEGGPDYPVYGFKEGMGGGAAFDAAAPGSKDVTMNVNITYKVVGR